MTTEKPRKRRGPYAMQAKEAAKLAKLFQVCMTEIGANPTPDGWFAYELDTPLGMLGIHDLNTEYCHINAAFDNHAMAAGYTDCNPHSGKWNWHFPKELTAAEVIDAFMRRLGFYLDIQPNYRGCRITPESSDRPIYFGVGLKGMDWQGYSRQFVRVIFPDLTWIRCANPEEAKRYIDGPNGLAAHGGPAQ